jgi:hypothetical protein
MYSEISKHGLEDNWQDVLDFEGINLAQNMYQTRVFMNTATNTLLILLYDKNFVLLYFVAKQKLRLTDITCY